MPFLFNAGFPATFLYNGCMIKKPLFITFLTSLLLAACTLPPVNQQTSEAAVPKAEEAAVSHRKLTGRLVTNRPHIFPANAVAHIRLLDITPGTQSAVLVTQAEFQIPALPRQFKISAPKESLDKFPKLYVSVQIIHEGQMLYNNLIDVIVTPDTQDIQVPLKAN